IAQARSVIDAQFTGTPQFVTKVPGATSELLLKVETVNPLRSFKGRGTGYLLSALPGREPLACASAGNFGQALALAAARRGRPVHVFTASNVDPFKAARMRRLDAELHVTDEDFDGAKEQARQHANEEGWFFVEDGGDPRIAEGAGTIAAEMEAAPRWPDVIVA